jgi:hypothetical protein
MTGPLYSEGADESSLLKPIDEVNFKDRENLTYADEDESGHDFQSGR